MKVILVLSQEDLLEESQKKFREGFQKELLKKKL